MRDRLELYKQGKPYREGPKKKSPVDRHSNAKNGGDSFLRDQNQVTSPFP